MKVPFRFQASDYDCVPTTLLNALTYLYDRDAIPPLAIQRIFTYCLDTVTSRQSLGHGTSGYAVQLFANWLNEYHTKKFRISAKYVSGAEVHLSKNNPIAKTLNAGGVAALRVKSSHAGWHYILGLELDADWLYAFDPSPKRGVPGEYEFVKKWAGGQAYNLSVRRSWIGVSSNQRPYRFGSESEREVLLLERLVG